MSMTMFLQRRIAKRTFRPANDFAGLLCHTRSVAAGTPEQGGVSKTSAGFSKKNFVFLERAPACLMNPSSSWVWASLSPLWKMNWTNERPIIHADTQDPLTSRFLNWMKSTSKGVAQSNSSTWHKLSPAQLREPSNSHVHPKKDEHSACGYSSASACTGQPPWLCLGCASRHAALLLVQLCADVRPDPCACALFNFGIDV